MEQRQASNLDRVIQFSFPSNHLLTLQLVKSKDNNSARPDHFFFVGFIPGVKSDTTSTGRTYDFNNAVNIKFSIQEVGGLGFALKQYALGNGRHIQYVKFAKSAGSSKILSLIDSEKTQQGKDGAEFKTRTVTIRAAVSSNNAAHAMALTIEQAHSLGDVCEELFKKALHLEFDNQSNSTKYTKPEQKYNTSPPLSDNSTPSSDDDDNSNFLGGSFSGFGGSPFG